MLNIKKEDNTDSLRLGEHAKNGYISDESSFYGTVVPPSQTCVYLVPLNYLNGQILTLTIYPAGDDEEKAELEHDASSFKTLHYWENIHPFSLATIAHKQRTMALQTSLPSVDIDMKDAPPRRDPFEGVPEFYQRTESVRDFITRLAPSTTDTSVVGPWLFVHNLHAHHKVTSENIQGFRAAGRALLEAFESLKASPKQEGVSQAQHKQNINAARHKLETDILECARQNGVTAGKWMLFVPENRVDEVWETVVGATTMGYLGIQAKVAAKAAGKHHPRLIAVYTRDFADKEDIKRVLVKLADLGLASNKSSRGQIYYKCDAHTYLDIFTKNEWGISPSMHSSGEMLRNGQPSLLRYL